MDDKTWKVIGTMSGTSCDGLDIACCEFKKVNGAWDFQLLHSVSDSYREDFLERMLEAHTLPPDIYAELDEDYAIVNANRINEFIEKNGIENLDAIVSHGHTVYHEPGVKSLQMGNGQIIANKVNLPVVANLRTADVEKGGQGAPIVPIGDLHLFSDYRFCLNLGGIANISVKSSDGIRAWDICGCNLLLNHFANSLGFDFDNNGQLAKRGKTNQQLLQRMMDYPFLNQSPPKSLEKQHVLNWLISLPGLDEVLSEDALNTSVEFIVQSIARALAMEKVGPQDKMLVSGGGAHNAYLIEQLRNRLSIEVEVPVEEIIDFKEALVMAFFGVLHLRKETNCLPSVTGASEAVSGGELFVPIP